MKKKIQDRKYQEKACNDTVKYLSKYSRCKVTMPCGSGKTIVALRICEKMDLNRVVVCVPNLTLESQIFRDWYNYFSDTYSFLCIGSDKSIGSNEGLTATTEPEDIKRTLKKRSNKKIIVLATYQSVHLLSEVVNDIGYSFNIGIIDEAHRTVGQKDRSFSKILFDDQIKIGKRIFMTATEKFFKNSSEEVVSMDDVEIYGETAYKLTIKEAIDLEVLTDYVLKSLVVTEEEIRELIQENVLVNDDSGIITREYMKEIAACIAILDSIENDGIKHILTYHRTIASAKRFQSLIFKISTMKNVVLNTYHINGTETKGNSRTKILTAFQNSPISLLTSARALVEGVDMPNVDAICFVDWKKSMLEITQAVGRSFRIHPDKNISQIICPVIDGHEDSYNTIIDTVKALAGSDSRILDSFKKQSSSKKDKKHHFIDLKKGINKIINIEKIQNDISYKIEVGLRSFLFATFEEARECVIKNKIKSREDYRLNYKKLPLILPSSPFYTYKNEWQGWPYFLNKRGAFVSFKEARECVIKHRIKERKDYERNYKNLPLNLPCGPERVYKNEWQGWPYFFNMKQIASFKEARKCAIEHGIKTNKEYRKRYKNLPLKLPYEPDIFYKDEWQGWPYFFGKKTIFASFKEARKCAIEHGIKTCLEYKKKIQKYANKTSIPT